MRAQITSHDYEQLSAYLDGQLADSDRRRLEERLHAQPDLQQSLDELTRTRALLRTAPRRRAPRNFTLTPAMVGSPTTRRFSNFLNLFPALSFASALAAIALVVSIAFQLLPGRQMLASQPAADTAAYEVAREMKAQNQAQEATGAAGAEPGMMAVQEAPAATAPAAMAAPQAAEMAAGEASAPPVIFWGGVPYATGMGGGGDGRGGGGGAGVAPGCPDGRCGGAADSIYGAGGMGGAVDGSLVVPVAPEESSTKRGAEEEAAPKTVQPDSSISGSGPILGVPAGDVEGQVIEYPLYPSQPEEAPAPSAEEVYEAEQAPAARNNLLLIQILLGLVAVVTGAAAFLIRRSRAR